MKGSYSWMPSSRAQRSAIAGTPSPATPGGPGAPTTPGGGGRGMPISFTRQATSKEILELDWHYPVAHTFKDKSNTGEQTTVAFVEKAFARKEAFYKLAEGNKKPLLVMRECVSCKGTDHALFSRRLNNEKTMLLCQWFYCVKLPPRVLEKNHPFRNVFAKENPPHLFISMADGSDITEFDGRQTQSRLQKAMVKLLQKTYEKKPLVAVSAMLRLLSECDKHDAMVDELQARLNKEMLRTPIRKDSIAKVKAKLATTKKQRARALKLAKAVCDLKLRIAKEPAKKAAPGKAAPGKSQPKKAVGG